MSLLLDVLYRHSLQAVAHRIGIGHLIVADDGLSGSSELILTMTGIGATLRPMKPWGGLTALVISFGRGVAFLGGCLWYARRTLLQP